MKKLLFTILLIFPLIGIGQVTKFAEMSYISSVDKVQRLWITDTPLTLIGEREVKAIEFLYPENDGFMIVDKFSESTDGKKNVITYPTMGDYKIIVEKNKGKTNEEGVIILTTSFSVGGIPDGKNFVLNYRFISETEVIITIDNKKSLYYMIPYNQIK